MAAGDFAGKVLRMTAGVMSEIDPKNTLKMMGKEGVEHFSKNSGAFKAGKNTADFLAGGIKGTIKNMSKKDGGPGLSLGKAIKAAHGDTIKITNDKLAKEFNKKIGEEAYKLSGKRVAGTAIGIGLAGRVVTGGGLYRDQHGKVNIPGIPFI